MLQAHLNRDFGQHIFTDAFAHQICVIGLGSTDIDTHFVRHLNQCEDVEQQTILIILRVDPKASLFKSWQRCSGRRQMLVMKE